MQQGERGHRAARGNSSVLPADRALFSYFSVLTWFLLGHFCALSKGLNNVR